MSRPLQAVLGVLVVVLVGVGALLGWRQARPLPVATLSGEARPMGRGAHDVVIHLEAPAGQLRAVDVRIAQGGQEKLARSEDLAPRDASSLDWTLELDPAQAGLAEGEAELRVIVTDDQWRPKQDPAPRLVTTLTIDMTPPELEYVSATRYVKHAGTALAVYRVEGAAASGVRAGGRDFPGVAGLSSDPNVRVSLFTIPYDQPREQPWLVASDEAGNARAVPLAMSFLEARFERDTFEIKDEFMARKVAELTPSADTTSPEKTLASYLDINGTMRAADEAKIHGIGASASEARPLWSGAFAQQPSSKVFAYFPQQRDLLYGGAVVDTQWHLGLDLASTERTPVLAANTGKTLFAGDNGIYGNMVVLDHGLGLTSLYAHLSSISVGLGQIVTKGEPVGISGATGLAGGDHLHFAMMVHGTYTNPIDWFDAGYIHDRIALPLTEAGIAQPGVTDLSEPQRGAAPKAGKPSARKAAKREGRRRR